MSEYLRPVVASLVALLVLFIITKIMGKRQIAQLSFFDYIIGISVGSIAAEMSIDHAIFWDGIISIFVYGLVATGISIGACKYIWLRRFVSGGSTVLYEKGQVYSKNLLKAKIDINELLTECRYHGYFDLSKLHSVILEQNGKMSFIPLAGEEPLTPQHMGIVTTQQVALANVVLDGQVMTRNLKATGNNRAWLDKQLASQGVRLNQVAIATCEVETNTLTVFTTGEDRLKHDLFF